MTAARLNPYPKRLDEAAVAAIRAEVGTCCVTCGRQTRYRDIGARHGVSVATVSIIATGRSWRSVPTATPSTNGTPAAANAGVPQQQETDSHAQP